MCPWFEINLLHIQQQQMKEFHQLSNNGYIYTVYSNQSILIKKIYIERGKDLIKKDLPSSSSQTLNRKGLWKLIVSIYLFFIHTHT